MESLQHNGRNGSAVAYATTTLVGGAPVRNGTVNGGPAGGGCIPNPQAYMIQPAGDSMLARREGSEPRMEQAPYQGMWSEFKSIQTFSFYEISLISNPRIFLHL